MSDKVITAEESNAAAAKGANNRRNEIKAKVRAAVKVEGKIKTLNVRGGKAFFEFVPKPTEKNKTPAAIRGSIAL